MSGPKVVRVVTREELEAISRREIAVATAAAHELLMAYRRTTRLTDKVEQEIADQLRRLASLKDSGRFDEVQRQAPQVAAFMRSEAERVAQEAIAAAENARGRRRRVAESATSLVRALEAAGQSAPAELMEAVAKAGSAGADDIDALQAIVNRGLRLLANTHGRARDPIGAKAMELAARLSQSEQGLTIETWFAANGAESAASKRLDAALAVIEALGEPALVARYQERARSIAAATVEKQALLLDSLLLDASREARRVREDASCRARLIEAAAALEAVGAPSALAHAGLIWEAVRRNEYARADELLTTAASISDRELSSSAGEARRNAVLGGLAALGYEVREGMATAWVRDGRLVLRKPSSADYGVEIGAPADASRVQVRLVGSDQPATPRDQNRDRDQETVWCSEFAELQTMARQSGATLALERGTEPGAQPVKTIHFEDAAVARSHEIEKPLRGRTIR